jgi:uncharacterized integral membrane protein (TIGR00697 family)
MSDTPRAGASVPQVALVGLFVTALVTAQVTAPKLLQFDLPVELPLVDGALVLPGAALAYALTFFASDCYAELYGRRAATVVVNVGFAMSLVLLALVWTTLEAPALPAAAPGQVDLGAFRSVLGQSPRIVAGSLGAYVISQNWDVFVFDRIRAATGGDYLWLRNLGSTATSQLIDTAVFVGVAFVLLGSTTPETALALAAGQYLFKLGIAVLDTPVVYGVVALVRSQSGRESATAWAR